MEKFELNPRDTVERVLGKIEGLQIECSEGYRVIGPSIYEKTTQVTSFDDKELNYDGLSRVWVGLALILPEGMTNKEAVKLYHEGKCSSFKNENEKCEIAIISHSEKK